jgi:hypothetical protein
MMALSIRSPRVKELASALAKKRNMTMTQVILLALEKTKKIDQIERLRDINRKIAKDFNADGKDTGRTMTKDDIDRMWGHE